MKKTLLILSALLVTSLSFAESADLETQKNAVNSACADEAAKANCGDQKVGSGLLKCIHSHKKANREFKISDSCKEAMKHLKHERKERHEEIHEKREELREKRKEMHEKHKQMKEKRQEEKKGSE